MKYILARDSHSAGPQYLLRFNGAGRAYSCPNMIDAMIWHEEFDGKRIVEHIVSEVPEWRIIELSDKDVFEMRLKG